MEKVAVLCLYLELLHHQDPKSQDVRIVALAGKGITTSNALSGTEIMRRGRTSPVHVALDILTSMGYGYPEEMFDKEALHQTPSGETTMDWLLIRRLVMAEG